MTKSKLITWPFILMCCYEVLSGLAIELLSTLLSSYSAFLGAASWVSGLMLGFYYLFSMGSRTIAGFIGNRNNIKYVLICSDLVCMLSIATMGFCESIPGLILLRGLQGIAYSFQSAVLFVLVSGLVPEGRGGQAIGIYGLASIVSFMLGPTVGLWVSENFGFSQMFLVAAAAKTVAIIIVLCLPWKHIPNPELSMHDKFNLKDQVEKAAIVPTIIAFFMCQMSGSVTGYLALYAKEYGIAGTGAFFMVKAVSMFFGRTFATKNADKISLANSTLRCGILMGLGALSLGLFHVTVTTVLGIVLFGLGFGMMLPVNQSRAIKLSPEGKKSSGINTYYFGVDFGWACGSILGGILAGVLGYAGMYICFTVPLTLGVLYAMRFGKNK